MKTVHLARGLTLPAAELATKVTGAFGIRGSGKSNLMSVVIEGLLAARVQVIVLDPVGIHFSLRLAPDGKHPSDYQIPVLGGRHGDLALQPTAGEVVGRALALSNDSCVLDISSMKKGERIRFAGAFAEAFYEGKKENPAPVLLCLEEAQRFVPQLMFKGSGQEQMLGAFEELAEQGRNYGAGIWLNSLRPQKINKDVTSLMDLLFSFRLTGTHERKFVHDWLQEKNAEGRGEIDGELPGLPEGHALVWSPAVFNIFGKFHFVKKTTYDAGATPLYVRAKVKMRPLDLAGLEKEMATVVEEAKANDPRALRARIVELERAVKLTPAPGKTVEKTKIVEVPMLGKRDLQRIERLTTSIRDLNEQLDRNQRVESGVRAETNTLVKALVHESKLSPESRRLLQQGITDAKAGRLSPVPPAVTERPRQIRAADRMDESRIGRIEGFEIRGGRKVPVLAAPAFDPGDLPKYALDLLNVVAQRGKASDAQISALSGYRRTSSAFPKMLAKLTHAGLIEGTPRERVITAAGRARAGAVEALPTGRALLDHWLSKLTGYERLFLKTIHDAGSISREELAARTERSLSSSAFPKTIAALQRLALIEAPRGGDLTIAESFR